MTTREATALVLGGAGSVGAETVRQLARRGHFQRLSPTATSRRRSGWRRR